ncbi:hypothetical protein ACM39_02435 [Chryseobacterium sp. FH2]|uniref:hypothetical protein n=1 Tax=Chryseobacterium sp. FH2 TaxID=1674291 RepID=UPI00065A9582|nr:hypothetical protein [Chryseobacterium sp. FH2]KMQ69919.1 hypothetical protein ACM39_02435 [Chryseobacterium sp. FH2]
MNLTEKEAIELGLKIMKDISFLFDESDNIIAVYTDKSETKVISNNSWLVGFPYGKEDYGRNVGANLIIDDELKKGIDISFRNGSITLGYDEEKDKYFVAKKFP